MPPLPPTTVRVKRKATDDPVDVLRVQDEIGGVQPIRQYIFKRQRVVDTPLFEVSNFTGYRNVKEAPKIIATKPGDEYRDQRSQEIAQPDNARQQIAQPEIANAESTTVQSQPDSLGGRVSGEDNVPSGSPGPKAPLEPRRFHLSRLSSQSPTGGIANRKRGVKTSTSLFVERREPRVVQALLDQVVQRGVTSGKKDVVQLSSASDVSLSSVARPSHEVELPNDGSTKLGDEMQAYIVKDPTKSSVTPLVPLTTSPAPTFLRKSSSKYSPTAPALRYHERNQVPLSGVPNNDPKEDQSMEDVGEVEADGSDYVIDTYVRVPAELYRPEGYVSEIGLLILDSQPDLDEFYADDLDSDSETYEDEEDENAENHPSNDYPEDEEQSDDEYGRNPYLYGNDYASDNEDFEADEAKFSDEEKEGPKYVQSRRPWMLGKAHQGYARDEDEDDGL